MSAFNYLKNTMQGLSNILYNGSQNDSSYNNILDSIKRIIQDYNDNVEVKDKIKYTDFRIKK